MDCTFGFENTKMEENILDFFVKADNSKEIVFVDDNPIVFMEHKIWADGKYQRFTCLGPSCPLCKSGHQAKKVFVLTAIDKTEWIDRSGNVHGDNKVLFIGSMNVAPLLKKEKDRLGTLVGCRFRVSRTDKTAPAVGNRFEFLCKEDVSKYEKVDYKSYFSPLPEGRLEEFASKYL